MLFNTIQFAVFLLLPLALARDVFRQLLHKPSAGVYFVALGLSAERLLLGDQFRTGHDPLYNPWIQHGATHCHGVYVIGVLALTRIAEQSATRTGGAG
jgi:hypothetical protein